MGNEKFDENEDRIAKLEHELRVAFLEQDQQGKTGRQDLGDPDPFLSHSSNPPTTLPEPSGSRGLSTRGTNQAAPAAAIASPGSVGRLRRAGGAQKDAAGDGGDVNGITGGPAAADPPYAAGRVDPRRLLLGRQLKILKRLKALEAGVARVASAGGSEAKTDKGSGMTVKDSLMDPDRQLVSNSNMMGFQELDQGAESGSKPKVALAWQPLSSGLDSNGVLPQVHPDTLLR